MENTTPFMRAETVGEIAPAVPCPAARRLAACNVEWYTLPGTPAEAACSDKIAANKPPDTVTPRQSCRQQRSCSRQSPGHGPFGNPQLPSHVLACLAPDIAQNDKDSIFIRQAAQLFIKDGLEIVEDIHFERSRFGRRHPPFAHTPFGCHCPHPHSRLMGHAIEPVADHLLIAKARRLLDEHQESRLKGVLRIVLILEQTTAHSPNHRSRAPNQCREGSIVTGENERLE